MVSHAMSLAQCKAWLRQHLPKAEKIAVVSNAEAAQCNSTFVFVLPAVTGAVNPALTIMANALRIARGIAGSSGNEE